ncbi:argininosuccinate synthase [Methanopyrus sp. KOL6]|uniref:argininosuccinate synthase n=1 Tax=Methanopyrus sp. KOL6 TaxID=1937004 RepID=UPI000B4A6D0A|nr:argininosuccinate synthase [Methanopyrus sp. KOL6]
MSRVVLAYSGGLDTSVCIELLRERYGYDEVITVTADVGQPEEELREAEEKARKLADEHFTVDCVDEFVREYCWRAVKANATYEGYPLSTALARPLIAQKVLEVAREVDADAVAHGCTGKGNDQFRFESYLRAHGGEEFEIVAPVRDLDLTRHEEIAYAEERGIPVPVDVDSPYSVDENLWGRSIEGGVLEDPSEEPPEEVFEWTVSPAEAPDEPEVVEIEFERGVPVEVDGRDDPVEIVRYLNETAGGHGVGRIDIVEDRVIGLKSREVYEAPAAVTLLEAHRALEAFTLTRRELSLKASLEEEWARLVYDGLWFDPLREHLEAFFDSTQRYVEGTVCVKLFKGSSIVISRESPRALYEEELISYEEKQFDQRTAEGAVKLHGIQERLALRRRE